MAVGVAGAVLPALPGPPLAWIGLLIASFSPLADISATALVVTAAVMIAISVLDYVVPSLATKRLGGTKYGIWGCNIGLVLSLVGLPFGPQGVLGLVFWPFAGAFVGEMIEGGEWKPAVKAACGSFLGLMTGTLMKVLYCIVLIIMLIVALF